MIPRWKARFTKPIYKKFVSDDDLFRIEKVLKRQKDHVLVKWKGWPDKYNSWIANRDVTWLKKKKAWRLYPPHRFTWRRWVMPVPTSFLTFSSRSHHFKNRLPKSIWFVGWGWQVGMVSLSLPTIPVVGERFVNEKDPLLYVRWHESVWARWPRQWSLVDPNFLKNWFIATIEKEPIEPNPKTNRLKIMESSYTLPLNGPPEETCC